MNFAFDSVKDKSNAQHSGFCFGIEMPRGHFFAVLDFAPHDYANLDASLKSKLETIANSFTSLESFSPDLFLGFMAKEINNFVHNLAEQSGGPELLCSSALCLLDGKTLSYLLRGDTRIDLLKDDGLSPLNVRPGVEQRDTQLGANHLDTPLNGEVQPLTLREADVVVVMTRAMANAIAAQQFPLDQVNLSEADSQLICDELLKLGAAEGVDRALVVITGPFEQPSELAQSTGLNELSELKTSVAVLESRLNLLAESQQRTEFSDELLEKTIDARIEQKLERQIADLKDHLINKPATIDLLELDEKVKNLGTVLAGKAETAELREVRKKVRELGLANKTTANELSAAVIASKAGSGEDVVESVSPRQPRSFVMTALAVLLIALGAGFLGGWLSSRRTGVRQEVWTVKASGSDISIRREDGGGAGVVNLNTARPLNASGEQRFSSFGDVQRYIETLSETSAHQSQTNQTNQSTASTTNLANATPDAVTEITVKPGDSLKKFAQLYNVPAEKLMSLNPGIKRWERIPIGQRIFVPSESAAPVSPAASPSPAQSASSSAPAGTTEVTVGPGDSLNELARRFNTTAARLKELNPQMNWPRIQTGQKVMVPVPAGG
ncbi:MAG TPA: LysM peptidoglycan-binding domain-containing protein [Pyrinomonadaceae bacterium]|nr:LysM peptidoglycan-binding domain-containing protein [Pyrinomonadaceae bacterium]